MKIDLTKREIEFIIVLCFTYEKADASDNINYRRAKTILKKLSESIWGTKHNEKYKWTNQKTRGRNSKAERKA